MNFSGSVGFNGQPHRILVVDDEEIVLAALRATLERQQYEVVTTTDPMEALEKLRHLEFSVIISDQRMPPISGLELLSRARELQPHATRILITAVLSMDTVIDAINRGEVYRFIVKPWLREELLVTVKNAAQRYELVRQNQALHETTQTMNARLVSLNQSLENQVRSSEEQNHRLEKLNRQLEGHLLGTVQLCARTMRTFHPVLGSRAQRAVKLCQGMAAVLRLPPEEARVLECGAWLHDIGLVGMPRRVLRRWLRDPQSLDEAERVLIEQHSVLGQEMSSLHGGMERVGAVIRGHHERYDGGGYPDGLAGESIPWLARLLAVAVACSAEEFAPSEAADAAAQEAGTAFDPEAVRVLMRALPRNDTSRRERPVDLTHLEPGMVLARGIYTSSGLLLLSEGETLSGTAINKLLNHNRIQPINQLLVVYC